jgi:predicted phage baseplate assembly protein
MSVQISSRCRCDRERRTSIRASALNGLDYLEVDDADRRRLTVYLVAKLGPLREALTAANFVVTGGQRVRDIRIVSVTICPQRDPELDDCITVVVDAIGDFSTYTLCVVDADGNMASNRPHPAFDPLYACLDFTFQAGCPSPLDCAVPEVCPTPARERIAIDYLAKDYASFRQTILDRLSALLPGWTERHEPDLMMTLVELLAYEGDRLSYFQDAVATEAYLATARQRVSLRRHARLVDYAVHEGCNARAFVTVRVSQDTPPIPPGDFFFATAYPGAKADGTPVAEIDLERVPPDAYEVFEPVVQPAGQDIVRRTIRLDRLCLRLKEGATPVDRLLRDRLGAAARASLRAWDGRSAPSPSVEDQVLADLQRIADEQALHVELAFHPQRAAGEALRMLESPLRPDAVRRLNRILLRAALGDDAGPADGVRFYAAHDAITVYTWGRRGCCLPVGTRSATLLDTVAIDPAGGTGERATATTRSLQLEAGDFLLFEEVVGPTTGLEADADPRHRQVVRLARVERRVDAVARLPLLEVEWGAEDALTFPLCLSVQGPAPACEWIDGVSVARGNVLLVDHGRRGRDELDAVEVNAIDQPCDECRLDAQLLAAPYRPSLTRTDLTYARPVLPGMSASALVESEPRAALPQVRLRQVPVAPRRLHAPDPLARYRNPVPPTAFDPEDLVAPAALVARLQRAAQPPGHGSPDPSGQYLLALLDEQTRQEVADDRDPASTPASLVEGLLRALNQALDDDRLYDPARFPEPALDAATSALAADRPLPADLQRLLNRWLIEQAFPEAIGQTRRFMADWTPRYDLLASNAADRHFVVEMTDRRRARLRFGDGDLGRAPDAATRFRALYRVGNGSAGNVGADSIVLFVLRQGRLEGTTIQPRNPLAARGGTDAETLDEVRRRAPYAIRHDRQRAVTADDYGELAARDFAVQLQGAAGELAWNGSWYEAIARLDPRGRDDTSAELRSAVAARLERYRRMGHDLRVVPARYVPLDIGLTVCVKPGYLQAHVLAALMGAFGNRPLPDGTLGFFHPDNLRFAESVEVSGIVAAAQRVAGVQWSRVTRLERTGEGDGGELADGRVVLAPTEIARVDGAGAAGAVHGYPECGSITFEMEGGR